MRSLAGNEQSNANTRQTRADESIRLHSTQVVASGGEVSLEVGGLQLRERFVTPCLHTMSMLLTCS